ASYISSAGQAAKLPYNQATIESLLSMMNSADIGSDSGKMICNVECTRRYEVCIVAHDGNKLVDCGARITGNYTCLCSNPSRVTGVIPKVEQIDGIISKTKYLDVTEVCKGGKCKAKKELPGVTDGEEYESTTLSDEYKKYLDFDKEINSLSEEEKKEINKLTDEELKILFDTCLGPGTTDCASGWLKNQAALIGGNTPIDILQEFEQGNSNDQK
ncbi:MAG: hypothetical protein V2A62_05500, partial [Candidatus Woesearchaeota archaeon]